MSLLQSGPMRHLLQGQDLPQIAPLGDHLAGLSVVGFEELPKRQQGEELRLREVLTAELGRIGREPLLADLQSGPRQIDRRLGHGRHGLNPLSMTYRSAFS